MINRTKKQIANLKRHHPGMGFFFIFIFFLTGLAGLSWAQAMRSITLTTYFPPPVSAYNFLKLNTNASNLSGDNCNAQGTIQLGNPNQNTRTLLFCQNEANETYWTPLPGLWRQNKANTAILLSNPNQDGRQDNLGIDNTKPFYNLTFGIPYPSSGNPILIDGGIIASGQCVAIDGSLGANNASGECDVTTPTLNPVSGRTLTTAGPGARLLWYPKKSAFRAGGITCPPGGCNFLNCPNGICEGQQWNDANIGALSTAFGENNTAAALGAVVRGGQNNTITATANHSTIGGGHNNTITAPTSVISGGGYNQILNGTGRSFIGGGGGPNATVFDNQGKIVGGNGNQITSSGDMNAIGGGDWNQILGFAQHSGIIGGQNNIINAILPAVVHTPSQPNDDPQQMGSGFIGGGRDNIIEAPRPFGHMIYGGEGNQIVRNVPVGNNFFNALDFVANAIGGGQNNRIANGYGHVILGGQGNQITSTVPVNPNDYFQSAYSVIGGGQNNTIQITVQGQLFEGMSIGGGVGNTIQNSSFGVIAGGSTNQIAGNGTGSGNIIGGGAFNTIQNQSSNSTILGGSTNTILNQGGNPLAATQSAFIGGGQNNVAGGNSSVILGGRNNQALADFSLAGGENMQITNAATGTFAWGFADNATLINQPNAFIIFEALAANPNGIFVGIGTPTPTERLHIVGGPLNISNGSLVLSTVSARQNPANPLFLNNNQVGLDFAEIFEASEEVEAGDVLIMDTANKAFYRKSFSPYDRKVVGIVSAAPAMVFKGSEMVLNPKPFEFTKGTKPPVALKGQVAVKVSLENGPISIGDILTTSSTPGHAMKATDPQKETGAIIGKALTSFNGGPNGEKTGMVVVFVTLH